MINDFKLYITQTDIQDFLVKLINDNEFSNFIIENKLFWKHFDYIRSVYGEYECFQIIKLLSVKDKKFISDDMYIIFEYDYLNKEFFESLFDFFEFKEVMNINNLNTLLEDIINNKLKYINYKFIEYLLDSKYKNIVINNFEIILDNCYYLLDLKEVLKDKILLERYNNYINTNPNNLIYEILIKGFDLDLEEIKNEKIFDTVKLIIDELLSYQNLNYSDIQFIGCGGYNFVVSVGSKVLKIGRQREVFKMDNNKRFLKPLLRTEINKIDSNEVLGCIEITEKVSTENITEKDVYVVYKELRDNGYIWLDCRKTNVGRLLKDNKIHFNNLDPVLASINYNTSNQEELKEGDLVIIDNDYIYSDEEFEALSKEDRDSFLELVSSYESQYQSELNRRKK